MIEALRALYGILASDEALAGMLSDYGGLPAVFDQFAPADAGTPYVVARVISAVPEEGHATERMAYAVDVFDRSEDATRALEIAQRIEALLDGVKPQAQGITGLAVWRDFKGRVPEDDPGIQHVHLEFVVRYGRNDLFES